MSHLSTDFVFIESYLECVMKPKNVFLDDKYILIFVTDDVWM